MGRFQNMCLNAEFFTPAAYSDAQGLSRTTTEWLEANGGITLPKRVHLPQQVYYYRFASSDMPHAHRLGGPWWVEFDVLKKVAIFARETGATPRDAVRYFLAVPWRYSKVDRLIRARLVTRLDAYRGEGRAVNTQTEPAGAHPRDHDTVYIPPKHVHEIYQLYVPGMRELSGRAFVDVTDKDIWKSEHFR
jgi:hypothetical protein